jgi:hypothetical protein
MSLSAASVHAAQAAQESTKNPPTNPPASKVFTLSFRNQPWNKVFEWLAEQANLPFIAESVPAGTFTAVLPPERKVTLAEAIDLVNEALTGKYRLHRGANALLLVAADQRLDPAQVELVRVEDLPKRGRTEIVRVTLAVPGHKPETLLPEIKKLLGPFGEATTLGGDSGRLSSHCGDIRRSGGGGGSARKTAVAMAPISRPAGPPAHRRRLGGARFLRGAARAQRHQRTRMELPAQSQPS